MIRQAVRHRQAHGPEHSRRTHHPEPVEGQIIMTEIQNPKQLDFDLI